MLLLLSWEGLNGYDSLSYALTAGLNVVFLRQHDSHSFTFTLFEFLRRKQEKKVLTAFPLQAVIFDEGGESKQRRKESCRTTFLYYFTASIVNKMEWKRCLSL